jgi:hypothetical protein
LNSKKRVRYAELVFRAFGGLTERDSGEAQLMLMFAALYTLAMMYLLCLAVLSTLPSLEVEADLRYKPHSGYSGQNINAVPSTGCCTSAKI